MNAKKNYNPEKRSIYVKKYYQNNSEKVKEYKKKYYQENKEKCLKKNNKINNKTWIEKNNQIIECGCGSKIKKYKLWDHLQTKKHKKYIE